jgi:50S ribosomal protein L16 3-hydroxylase
MEKLTLLGNIAPAEFLRDYWHKKPLLIRQAIPQFTAPITSKELFKLAAQEDVESRLVSYFKQQWQLKKGPFGAHQHTQNRTLPDTNKKGWTLLVQGVNLHLPKADELLRQFNFLPEAR